MTEQLIEQTCEAIKAESKRLFAQQIHLDLADIRPFLKSLVESLSAPSEPSERLKGLVKKWRDRASFSSRQDVQHLLRDCAADLEAELGEPSDELPMGGWQPISTAPKDGTWIVVVGPLKGDNPTFRGMPRACVSRWFTKDDRHDSPAGVPGWNYSAPGYSNLIEPTHWQPLPSPQCAAQQAAREPHPTKESDGSPARYCDRCGQRMTMLRPYAHRCDNPRCPTNKEQAASEPQQAGERGPIDANVQSVINKHRLRAAAGLVKYGVTTERTDLTRLQWLQHAQEEMMDCAIYMEKLIGFENEKERILKEAFPLPSDAAAPQAEPTTEAS